MITDFVHFCTHVACEHASKMHVAFTKNSAYWSRGDFFVFYIKNGNKTKIICLNKKILRAFVDTHAHIPNIHVHFGAFSMVNNLALYAVDQLMGFLDPLQFGRFA